MSQQYLPPPGHQPLYPPPAPPPPSNGLATGGFVVALCGAVLSLIPIIGVVAWIVAPVGLVLSIVAMTRSARLGGRGLAQGGIVLGAVGLVVCMLWVIGLASSDRTRSGATTSGYSSPSPAPAGFAIPSVHGPFEDGTYLVGEELAAGSYRTDGSGGACFWSRLENTTGDFGSIAANGFVSGPTTITVRPGDAAVRFSGGCTWTRR